MSVLTNNYLIVTYVTINCYTKAEQASQTYVRENDLESFSNDYKVLSVAPAPAPTAWVDPVDNCLYGGNVSGHSKGFCTADACY